MGYTHYWTIGDEVTPDKEAFGRLLLDTKRIIDATDVPLAGGDGTGEPELSEGSIRFNGVAATGDNYETFYITPDSRGFDFCKTSGVRPYDAVVCAVLLRASEIYGPAIRVSSDGHWDDWADGSALYVKAFGTEPTVPSSIRGAVSA